MQADDTERIADARTRHHFDEERKERRRAQRAARRAAKALIVDGVAPAIGEGADEQLTSASERSQPAGTSASFEDQPVSQLTVKSLREKLKRGKASLHKEEKVPAPRGARAMAAARTNGHTSWGRAPLREDPLKSAYKLKPSKGLYSKQPALSTAHKYLKVIILSNGRSQEGRCGIAPTLQCCTTSVSEALH